jgi:hypothetical protein
MWEMVEILGVYTLMWAAMSFWMEPEQTMNRLGRCIAAFRRGLAGLPTEPKEQESVSEKIRD